MIAHKIAWQWEHIKWEQNISVPFIRKGNLWYREHMYSCSVSINIAKKCSVGVVMNVLCVC
jgi:hypothetical protein